MGSYKAGTMGRPHPTHRETNLCFAPQVTKDPLLALLLFPLPLQWAEQPHSWTHIPGFSPCQPPPSLLPAWGLLPRRPLPATVATGRRGPDITSTAECQQPLSKTPWALSHCTCPYQPFPTSSSLKILCIKCALHLGGHFQIGREGLGSADLKDPRVHWN